MLELIFRSSLPIVAALLLHPQGAAAEPTSSSPRGLSPGGLSRAETTASSCPTLSWSYQGESVGFFEVAVFDGGQLARVELSPADAVPVTRAVVPTGARSWTPSVESCPPAGGTYAWAVRALAEGEPTSWSPPRWFETASAPSRDTATELLARLREIRSIEGAALPSSPPMAAPIVAGGLVDHVFSTDGILEVGDLISADGFAQGSLESDSSAASGALGALRARRLQLNSDTIGTAGAVLVAQDSFLIDRGQLRLQDPGTGQVEGRLALDQVSVDWLEITGTVVLDTPWDWYPPGLGGGQAGSVAIELTSDEEVRLDTAGASCGDLPVRGVQLRETDDNQIGIQLLCGGTEGQP